MNPWHERLGCEVNVCSASHCDAQRMRKCALRKAWQERLAYLKVKRQELRNRGEVEQVDEQIRKMQQYD